MKKIALAATVLACCQAGVGLAGKSGEVGKGLQNGAVFWRGGNIDSTSRTLGLMINNAGVPLRHDKDFSSSSPRTAGRQVAVHLAVPESAAGNRAIAYPDALDSVASNDTLDSMGVRGRALAGAVVSANAVYNNICANGMYDQGTVYLLYERGNNSTSTAVSNNAGTILGPVGGAAGLKTNFSGPADINGRTLNGVQFGTVHQT